MEEDNGNFAMNNKVGEGSAFNNVGKGFTVE
ncbi:hypothetical protein A2U01_0115405, partial [Trifolium medium]|nr:hypothetical protein [Trifolium medium]